MTEENKNVNDEITENNNGDEQDNATFTQSEVDSQVGKAVEKAIANQRKKWEKEKEEEIKKAKSEAEEYAKLTQKEKEEAELTKRMEELEKREKELNNRQLLVQIESDLKENNLPVELADTLLSLQDNEKIKSKINDVKKHIDNKVNELVKEKLRQETPSDGTSDLTSDPFEKLMKKYKN